MHWNKQVVFLSRIVRVKQCPVLRHSAQTLSLTRLHTLLRTLRPRSPSIPPQATPSRGLLTSPARSLYGVRDPKKKSAPRPFPRPSPPPLPSPPPPPPDRAAWARLSSSLVGVPTSPSACVSSLTTPAASPVCHLHTGRMAKSKFEYVKQFETDDPCLANCWIIVRVDGKAFHKFTDVHHYMKPNDERGLSLMTRAAQAVMAEFPEVVLAYGQSDEYSFVFHRNSKLYNRRASKIMTNVVSLFASAFTLFWPRFFNTQELQYPPSFDARVVLYPSEENLKDYLSWRQADCHINNLYNTCFWKLVQDKGLTPARSQERLKGTLSSDKNELLYSEFNINYNTLPELYRKGSILIRPRDADPPSPEREMTNNLERGHTSTGKMNRKPSSVVLHTDIISKKFWEDHPNILSSKLHQS